MFHAGLYNMSKRPMGLNSHLNVLKRVNLDSFYHENCLKTNHPMYFDKRNYKLIHSFGAQIKACRD